MPNPWKLKQEMCEIGRRMYERGLVSAFEGNLSVRLGADRLLCTPSLMCKGQLKPEDLCYVDLTGKQLGGQRQRSSEIYLHLAIYRERSDVEAVVHTHAPHATAFAITHTPIPNCITGEVEVFLGEVPLAAYATPGSPAMGDAIAPLVRHANTILLANHGVVSFAKSLEQALHLTEILEAYCRTLILSRSLGPVQRLNDQNMKELMAVKQKLGIPDRRTIGESFENCDLAANNAFGRGFCESASSSGDTAQTTDLNMKSASRMNTPASSPGDHIAKADDVETLVREITDRVMSALHS